MSNGEIRPRGLRAFKRLEPPGPAAPVSRSASASTRTCCGSTSRRAAAPIARPRAAARARSSARRFPAASIARRSPTRVYLGAAVPIFGPITPGNRTWYRRRRPAPATTRPGRAALLAAPRADRPQRRRHARRPPTAHPAGFSILSAGRHTSASRTVAALQEQLRQARASRVDVVGARPGGIVAALRGRGLRQHLFRRCRRAAPIRRSTSTSGSVPATAHFWNPAQRDALDRVGEANRRPDARAVAGAAICAERQRAFAEVQRILADELPAIYFVARG